MIETIFLLCCALALGLIYWDIQRKALNHQHAVNKIKSKIATATNMTASFAAFSQGPKATLLLASSGPYNIFLYYKIVNGKIIEQHEITLQNITAVQLIINNTPYKAASTSSLPSINQRATEIARQELEAMGQDTLQNSKRIVLLLAHNTHENQETLAIPLFQATKEKNTILVSKILLNALWWQQFLFAFIGKSTAIDTEPS